LQASTRVVSLLVVLAGMLAAAAPVAHGAIPASLKSACTTQTPHPGYSYQFCDDGLPPSGGRTANPTGQSAVEVPARYQATAGDDWTGLPPSANDASMPGADPDGNIALDVDVTRPTTPAPPGGYPLIVFMHGCCSGNKTGWEATSFDAAGEKWHYSNAWFASRGYVVITYTARGFVSGENSGNRGSTGETQLDSRRFEINDYQHLAAQVADDPFFNVNPEKIATTGGSYGGGFSWLALTDPFWTSPGGKSMKLASTAPKYGWTDLVYSLVPNGSHFQTADRLPASDGSNTSTPFGLPKKSITAGLYDSGTTGIPPGTAHATFTQAITEAFGCLNSGDPFETNPACTNPIATTLPEFIRDRSAYYQNDWFSQMTGNASYRVPIFNSATLTDPLFTPVENTRMANRIQSLVPSYPIQQYYGDYQHFVQNKAKEWGDICGADRHVCRFSDYPGGDLNAAPAGLARTGVTTRLNRFVDHYVQPPGNPSQAQPSFDVTASLQVCPQNASGGQPADEPGETFTASSFEGLTPGQLDLDLTSAPQTTVHDASPNFHADSSDPVLNSIVNGGRCPVETQPAGPGVATFTSEPLPLQATMLGATTVSIDYTATTTAGNFQLNSRLYDVFPDGSAVMVDRGVRRVTAPSGTITYQLHGNGWRFQPGHRVRIEDAQDDDPFVRAANVPSSATIDHVQLEIPTRERFGYPRPQAAVNARVPLAIAYEECTAPNRSHSGGLGGVSCNPAGAASDYLTVGTFDSNGQEPKAGGYVKLQTLPGNGSTVADEADVRFTVNMTDVRNKVDLLDYADELLASLSLRVTDKSNRAGASGPFDQAATVTDLPLSCLLYT
jgi:hypothetical protein